MNRHGQTESLRSSRELSAADISGGKVCRSVVPDSGCRRTKSARSVALPYRSRYDEIATICRSLVRTTSDSRHWLTNVPEVGRTSASDAIESHQIQSDLVLDALCDRQPVQHVAESWRDVVIPSDACDEPCGSVKTPNGVSSDSVRTGQHCSSPPD
jgi:hypothetical protein